MDCRKILDETDGDVDQAVELLRERGLLVAQQSSFSQISEKDVDSFRKNGHGLYRYKGTASSVDIPSHITDIALGAFKNYIMLKHVTIPGGVKKLQPAFWGCTALESVELKHGVMEIAADAFWLLPNLKKVAIPKSVQSISSSAFLTMEYIQNMLAAKNMGKTTYNPIIKTGVFIMFAFEKLLRMHKSTFKTYGVKTFAELADCPRFIEDCRRLREQLTIYGEPGSVAEEYADKHNFKFIHINNFSEGDRI